MITPNIGSTSGKLTRQNVRQAPAPSTRLASISSWGIESSEA